MDIHLDSKKNSKLFTKLQKDGCICAQLNKQKRIGCWLNLKETSLLKTAFTQEVEEIKIET